MKYKVKVRYSYTGHFIINAENKEEARNFIENNYGSVSPNIHTNLNDEDVDDWDFPIHPEEKILSITKK